MDGEGLVTLRASLAEPEVRPIDISIELRYNATIADLRKVLTPRLQSSRHRDLSRRIRRGRGAE